MASGRLDSSGPALALWTLLFTLPLAAASWFGIERPFLRGASRAAAEFP